MSDDKKPNIATLKEINRNFDLVEKGLCGYCGRDPQTPICRYPEMHLLPLAEER